MQKTSELFRLISYHKIDKQERQSVVYFILFYVYGSNVLLMIENSNLMYF